jgi:hypothetical protein
MLPSSWMKPFPTMDSLQRAQKKQSLCQASFSKATNLVLPSPPRPGEILKINFGIFTSRDGNPRHVLDFAALKKKKSQSTNVYYVHQQNKNPKDLKACVDDSLRQS